MGSFRIAISTLPLHFVHLRCAYLRADQKPVAGFNVVSCPPLSMCSVKLFLLLLLSRQLPALHRAPSLLKSATVRECQQDVVLPPLRCQTFLIPTLDLRKRYHRAWVALTSKTLFAHRFISTRGERLPSPQLPSIHNLKVPKSKEKVPSTQKRATPLSLLQSCWRLWPHSRPTIAVSKRRLSLLTSVHNMLCCTCW